MPLGYSRVFYCGWCQHGPISWSFNDFCPNGHRLRDRTCIVEYITATVDRLLDTPGQTPAQLDLQDASSEEYTQPPTPPAASEGEHDEQNIESVITPSESSTSPKDSRANVNDSNISRTWKHSLLEDYLCIKPEDPWNQELVAYAARTRLPGESSFSVETGEPATIPRRQRYNPRRRAEVAYTRNNGGACEGCRRNRRACRHRLEELEAIVDGHGATSEQVMARGGARRDATDRVAFDSAIDNEAGNQHGEAAIDPGGPFPTTFSASSQPQRRSAPQTRVHRRKRSGAYGDLSAARGQRALLTSLSPANGDEHETGVRQPHIPVGPDALRTPPAQRYVGQGRSTSIDAQRNRQLNNSATFSTRQNNAARRVTQALEPLHDTETEFGELSYIDERNVLIWPPAIPHNEQNFALFESTSATSNANLNTPLNQRSRPPLGSPWSEVAEGEDGYLDRTPRELSTHIYPPAPPFQYFNSATPARNVDDLGQGAFGLPQTHWLPSQPSPMRQHPFEESADSNALIIGDSRDRPYHQLTPAPNHQQELPILPNEGPVWVTEDLSWLDVDPSERYLDTSWFDQLSAAGPIEDDVNLATQPPIATGDLPQSLEPHQSNDLDLHSEFTWNNDPYHVEHTDTGVDSPSGGYMAFLHDPDLTPRLESTIGSWSDPILTPPSEGNIENSHG